MGKKFVFTTNDGKEIRLRSQEELDLMERMSVSLGNWVEFFSEIGVDITSVEVGNFFTEMVKVVKFMKNPPPGKKIRLNYGEGYFHIEIIPAYLADNEFLM